MPCVVSFTHADTAYPFLRSLHGLHDKACKAIYETVRKALRSLLHAAPQVINLAPTPNVGSKVARHIVETFLDLADKIERCCVR